MNDLTKGQLSTLGKLQFEAYDIAKQGQADSTDSEEEIDFNL